MATDYQSYADKTRSEKIVLCWVEPVERLVVWTLDSGAIYRRTVSHFVVDILEGTTSLVEASSSSLSTGEWFFDSLTNIVYVRTSDDSNPNTKDIVATYRKFYSNSPIDLPYNLASGADVHYEGALKTVTPINKEIDFENSSIALESNTTVTLENTDGGFDDIYDTLFWENKNVTIYSWNENILLSEKKLIFSGTIEDKSFSLSKVTFKCKDFIFKLREPLPLDVFSTGDGTITDSVLNTPKRRIYGRADSLKCVPIDSTLNGFPLTGTMTIDASSTAITGVGTSFLDECSPSDVINFTAAGIDYEITVESVDSDTAITMPETAPITHFGFVANNKPERPWRKKNRDWHIAGHKLRAPSTTISSVVGANRFSVVDGSDIFDDDTIAVDGEDAIVRRITGNDIVLSANLQAGIPSISDTVIKNPISKAYIGSSQIFINRDWTLTNTTESILNLTDTAERDITKIRKIPGTLTFTISSRTVTATSVDLVNEVQSRDWVRSSDITHTTWYEVLSVSETELVLRVAYAGSTIPDSSSEKRNVDLLDDDSLITVDCMGMESSSLWVKTGSDAVKNLLEVDGGFTNLNAASFTQSDIDAPYTLSMVIPDRVGGNAPTIRDTISKINTSIFGSLVNNTDWELVYNVLTPDKPTTLNAIEDHDIIGDPTVESLNAAVKKVNAKYRPFVDRFNGEDSFKLIEFDNEFVNTYIGAKAEKDVTIFLYDDNEAQEIAERFGLYNSLSQSVVSISAKMNFMLSNLNDKVYLALDRLYKRFAGKDRTKIGIITSISKNGESTSLKITDLGNVFNRIPSVGDDSSSDFTSATNGEKILNGYVLDDDLEIPDVTDDQFIGSGLIG